MNNWGIDSVQMLFEIFSWALFYDLLVISFVNLPFYFILSLINTFKTKASSLNFYIFLIIVFANTIPVLLSLFDVFYYRFHLQRSDADLLFVLFNPFTKGGYLAYLYLITGLLVMFLVFIYLYRPFKKIAFGKTHLTSFWIFLFVFFAFASTVSVFFKKKLHPNYPLTSLSHIQIPLVQNSFHFFLYSLYRQEEVPFYRNKSLNSLKQDEVLKIKKINQVVSPVQKNIVLFIMESVPYDYFNPESPDHLNLPFLDSLREFSLQFNTSYSFSYNSNKGITALLAGLPTVTDIPIYHSSFINIPHTGVGNELRRSGYTSSFFIGDDYDDFGFAKCCNWLGIDNYYCSSDMTNKKNMSKHTFGLHDEVVLEFMLKKLNNTPDPFFAINYNISTHYPYDLPGTYSVPEYATKLSKSKRAMIYYDHCLQNFFSEAKNKSWFSNTVFIFCSDHSLVNRESYSPSDQEGSFRIPLFIYDPQRSVKEIYSSPVSQLDIMNTIMAYASNSDSLISYGINLLEFPHDKNRVVFTKKNNAIYQAIDTKYVLGFDVYNDKIAYVYDYNNDRECQNNLMSKSNDPDIKRLTKEMEMFLKAIVLQYKR